MKHSLAAAVLALSLSACTAQQQATVSTVCQDIARMPPAAIAILDAQDPHGAAGILWLDTKAACANGVPTPGVDVSWGAMIWGELKVLIPAVLPQLIPLLIGLL